MWGFEPQLAEPKSAVLPLHHTSIMAIQTYSIRWGMTSTVKQLPVTQDAHHQASFQQLSLVASIKSSEGSRCRYSVHSWLDSGFFIWYVCAPWRTWTYDSLVMSQALWPTELREHWEEYITAVLSLLLCQTKTTQHEYVLPRGVEPLSRD